MLGKQLELSYSMSFSSNRIYVGINNNSYLTFKVNYSVADGLPNNNNERQIIKSSFTEQFKISYQGIFSLSR